MRKAILLGANLREADLYGANLTGAHLGGANLREANLRRTTLHQATFTTKANIVTRLNLIGHYGRRVSRAADLSEANLRGDRKRATQSMQERASQTKRGA